MKRYGLALLLGLFLTTTSLQVQATNSVIDTSTVQPVELNTKTESQPKMETTGVEVDLGLPSVTGDQVVQNISGKIYEIVGWLQEIAGPVAIVLIGICGFMMLFGSFGGQDMLSRGITGIVIVGFAYLVIMYAPQLLQWFVDWMKSTPAP